MAWVNQTSLGKTEQIRESTKIHTISVISELHCIHWPKGSFLTKEEPTLPIIFSINLLVVYRESVNLIGYFTRRLTADSQQL